MIVLPNGSYSLELNQTNEQDGTVVVTLKFKRVGEAQQPAQDNFKTVEQVQEMLNETQDTPVVNNSPWGQAAKTETVVQQTPDLNQVRQETQELMSTHVATQPQTQPASNPWSAANPVQTNVPVTTQMPNQGAGWGQPVTQNPPVTQPVQQPVTQPGASPWGGAPTTQQSTEVSIVQAEAQTATAVMEPPPVEEKKTRRGRKPKEDTATQSTVTEINLNGLRTSTQPDGTVVFIKSEDPNSIDPFIIKYPTNDDFFTVEVYQPAFQIFGEVLNKYNAQLNQDKGCGVLTINEEIFSVEFLPLMVR